MAPLHKFNPVRLAYIRDRAAAHFGRDPNRLDSLSGLRMLDIGCGAGVLVRAAGAAWRMPSSAPIRRTAISPSPSITPSNPGLAIDYRATTAEALEAAGESFDIVLAMEVVEHVTDVGLFIDVAAEMVKPGGLMFVATLNRTVKSFALAIVGAEYILRWLPRGTHQWDKFVTPNELEIAIAQSGLHVTDQAGVIYNLLADRWQLSTDIDVNYLVTAAKPER